MRRRGAKIEVRGGHGPILPPDSGMSMIKVTTTGSEARLVERLSALGDSRPGWSAIYFAFDKLLEHYRSDYQIKIAINLMKDLLKDHDGHIFLMKDSTIVLIAENAGRQLIEKVVFQLRYLFMDDPLAYNVDGEENRDFCLVYDLASEISELMAVGRHKMLMEGRLARVPGGSVGGNRPPETVASQPAVEAPPPEKIRFFNASSLATIERNLLETDLSGVLRRQPICAAIPDMTVRKVFDELYINIAHLRQTMGLDIDLFSNRWLFKYLTEILDQRMLKMISARPSRFVDSPISLNLNVRSLMSRHFQELDEALNPSLKVAIVIEVQIADVFEDMHGFLTARDHVQRQGYRVCLDGLSDLAFTQIDRESLGFDLIKLQWNADKAIDPQDYHGKKMVEAVKRCGSNRIILTRCDNRKAVEYGQSFGISLFQGRYLDKLMNPLSKIEN